MIFRDNWSTKNNENNSVDNSPSEEFAFFNSKENTIDSVKHNFNYRRLYSAEGYEVEIDGTKEKCLVQVDSYAYS